MRNLNEFISPCPVKTPAMRVQVIDNNGDLVKIFDAPPGFQLERYVDAVYPENEFMMYSTGQEVNISVIDDESKIIEVYRGIYE